jgi:hypothetical protein
LILLADSPVGGHQIDHTHPILTNDFQAIINPESRRGFGGGQQAFGVGDFENQGYRQGFGGGGDYKVGNQGFGFGDFENQGYHQGFGGGEDYQVGNQGFGFGRGHQGGNY